MAERRERAAESEQASKLWEEKKRATQWMSSSRPATPRPAWRPARTLHRVPETWLSRIQSSRKLSLNKQQLDCDERYSQDSFSSCASTDSRETDNHTGTMKTVQVCCRTLKYLCTCDK